MALEARAGLKGLILLARGCPARSQGDGGMREFRMGMLDSDKGASAMECGSMSVG